MTSPPVTKSQQTSGPHAPGLVLQVNLPAGMDPAVAALLKPKIEQALGLLMLVEQPRVIERADHLAELLGGKIEPGTGLIEERLARLNTIKSILREGEWLTSKQLNALQPNPPTQKSMRASDWKRRGRVFSVNYGGREYFAKYQFDEAYQPLPIIRDILQAIGTVADTWKIASWFNFPNGWISNAGKPVAPKDALDQRDAVLRAASARQGSHVA